jgi:propionyl-CoA carboxylase alpha chain
MAEEGVLIGPAPAVQSYLSIESILAAARATGAEAVHPGYGFLSENAAFARALAAAGTVFIGPPPEAIEAMGDKIESKKRANRAGVTTVPGHLGVIEDADEAERIAAAIGYPVMVKASAGGGGKGMRIAWSKAELREALRSAGNEARSSFGDPRVFLERYIEAPRHIEIQVLADSHGNVIHLGERECSIQRRHQKVVEEAPAPFLDAETRAAMGAQAVALARAVGYQSAGTVEFIVDPQRNFYFLEMNTRLQVEHPVTEMVTGLDLVEEMIRIAAGEVLRLRQDEVELKGSAIEARIYAEDPFRGFLPSIGRITRYRPPANWKHSDDEVRVDSGVAEGSEVSLFYDPMLAKLIVHGASRARSIHQMEKMLHHFTIEGVRHNIPFLAALMAHPRWHEGRLSTAFIAEEFPDGYSGAPTDDWDGGMLAAVAISVEVIEMRRRLGHAGDFTHRLAATEWVIALEWRHLPFRIEQVAMTDTDLAYSVVFADLPAVRIEGVKWYPGDAVWYGKVAGERTFAHIERTGSMLTVGCRGGWQKARLLTSRTAALAALMPKTSEADSYKALRCPMPGLVVSIAVKEGQDVSAGEMLATVEAMKMENVLRAERSATDSRILAKPGDSLAVDAVIMEFA